MATNFNNIASDEIINLPSGGQAKGPVANIRMRRGYHIGIYNGLQVYYSPSWREWFQGEPPTDDHGELDREW